MVVAGEVVRFASREDILSLLAGWPMDGDQRRDATGKNEDPGTLSAAKRAEPIEETSRDRAKQNDERKHG